ncbi:MAG TPA: META domain-containing protein [Burkholderiaceae bacterium]|jgi:heat shock protein HslJ|nr:META domain-containing protein [Burkholderiaceae bacterium]HQR78478.1 META domain-containing protein [Burkholderiaceae bacterium]
MKYVHSLLAGLMLAMGLAGCSAMPAAADVPTLDGTAWVLAALPGRTLVNGSTATLSFEGGRAQGSDSCNRFGIPFTTRGSAIDLSGQGMATQMACPPAVAQQAEAFRAALSGARTYRVAGGQLQLLGAEGALLAAFTAQSRSLAGTTWQVTGINNGRNALVSLVAGSTVTLQFLADGKVAGSAGCNQYTARYEAEGAKLRILAPASTRRMCPDSGVMEQEQAFLKALEAVTTMRMEGNRVELRDAQGAMQVVAAKSSGA